MRKTIHAPFEQLEARRAEFGGVEFTLNGVRYGVTEEVLADCFLDGEEIKDPLKVFKAHAGEILARAPCWARRRRGGLLMIFRDDIPAAQRSRHSAPRKPATELQLDTTNAADAQTEAGAETESTA